MERIEVSIMCVVYNQAEYIKDALDGFLSQKTDFEYEILLHDDASTDGTVEILKEYQCKYPQKIQLVLETENQHSRGADIAMDIMLPYVRGKYIAYCEGDDYWSYEGKLQAQYDLMESHPEVSLCYHNGITHDLKKEELGLIVTGHKSGYIEDEEIICPANGWYPTSSSFYRTVYLAEKPMLGAPTGDEEMRLYMACRGKIYFINKVWCTFRRFAKGAWYAKYCMDKGIADQYNKELLTFLRKYNEYSDKKYEEYLYGRIRWNFMYYIGKFYGGIYTLAEFYEYVQELKVMTEHVADEVLNRFYQIEAIHCSDYLQIVIEEKILRQVAEGAPVYICGMEYDALRAITMLLQHNIDIKGIVAPDNGFNSDSFVSYPVSRIDEFECEDNAAIWVCLRKRYKEIRMLQDRGFKNVVY